MFDMSSVRLLFIVLIALLTYGCANSRIKPSATSGVSTASVEASCEQLKSWVSHVFAFPLPPEGKQISARARKHYRDLFYEPHFSDVFGKEFAQLEDHERDALKKGLEGAEKKCGHLVSLVRYPRFLSYPFNRSLDSNVVNSNFSHAYIMQGIDKRAEIREHIASLPSIEGTYDGHCRSSRTRSSQHVVLSVGSKLDNGTYAATYSIGGLVLKETPALISIVNDPVIIRDVKEQVVTVDIPALGLWQNSDFKSKVHVSETGAVYRIAIDMRKGCSDHWVMRFIPPPEIQEALPKQNYDRPNVLCWGMYQWLNSSFDAYNNALSINKEYTKVLSDYDPINVFYYSLAYHRFKQVFGVGLSEMSDTSLRMLFEQYNACAQFSDRKEQFKHRSGQVRDFWNITEYSINKHIEILKMYDENARTSSADFEAFLKEVASTPEKIETLATVENMLTRFTNEFAVLPPQQFNDYLEALSERVNAQKLMIHLMNEAGLTVPPKLAIISEKGEEITPDDAKLKSWDNDKYIKMSKPLVL